MIIDKELMFSDKQALTVSAASTNVVKTGEDAGSGTPVKIFCHVDESFASAGALTVKFSVQSASAEDFSSSVTHYETTEIPYAELTAGSDVELGALPDVHGKYVRLYYTLSDTATAGKVSSGLTLIRQS